jgi:DNA-binding NarL/FixJ family response regulator
MTKGLASVPGPRPTRLPTIVLADDHVVFAEGVVGILRGHFEVLEVVADGAHLCDTVRRLRPDVLVTDISMPGMSALDVLRQLRSEDNRTSIVFLTMHADARLAAEAFRLGANAFVLKHTSGGELVKGIQAVMRGQKYMSPELTKDVLNQMSSPEGRPEDALTVRQREVLRLIVQGRRIKEIASALDLSPRTVETIKYDIMRLLDVHSTPQLIRFAIEHRVVVL